MRQAPIRMEQQRFQAEWMAHQQRLALHAAELEQRGIEAEQRRQDEMYRVWIGLRQAAAMEAMARGR